MDLAALITTAKGGRSYEQLEKDCGGSPKAARLQQLATQPQQNFPDPQTIRSLARGLRVSERVVVLAVAESFGLDVAATDSSLQLLLPPSTAGLSERQVGAVLTVVHAMLEPEPVTAATVTPMRPRQTKRRSPVGKAARETAAGDSAVRRDMSTAGEHSQETPGDDPK